MIVLPNSLTGESMGRKNIYGHSKLRLREGRDFEYILKLPVDVLQVITGRLYAPWCGRCYDVKGIETIVIDLDTINLGIAVNRFNQIDPLAKGLVKKARDLLDGATTAPDYRLMLDEQTKSMSQQRASDVLVADKALSDAGLLPPLAELIAKLHEQAGMPIVKLKAGQDAQDLERRELEICIEAPRRKKWCPPVVYYDRPEEFEEHAISKGLQSRLRTAIDENRDLPPELIKEVIKAIQPKTSKNVVKKPKRYVYPNRVDKILFATGLTMESGSDRQCLAGELIQAEINAHKTIIKKRATTDVRNLDRPV